MSTTKPLNRTDSRKEFKPILISAGKSPAFADSTRNLSQDLKTKKVITLLSLCRQTPQQKINRKSTNADIRRLFQGICGR